MGVTATVPILPGAAVNQERSYASYPEKQAPRVLWDRGSDETVNFRPQPPRDSSLPRTSSTPNETHKLLRFWMLLDNLMLP